MMGLHFPDCPAGLFMAYLVSPMKEHLLANCSLTPSGDEQMLIFAQNTATDFSLQGFLRALKLGNSAGLLSRIRYTFPKAVPATAGDALNYADTINRLLRHSQVFVVKDIDGSGDHFLRMDTVMQGPYERENIARFLDNVTEDVETLVQYFSNKPSTVHSLHSMPKEADSDFHGIKYYG